jgi:hypothetical protein
MKIASLTVIIITFLITQIASTNLPTEDQPNGFELVISSHGTSLYRRDNLNGFPEFVQVVHLNQGAVVQFLHGNIVDQGIDQGVYGGNNPGFTPQSLKEIWNGIDNSNPDVFCVTNGQFFSIQNGRTKLAFPLKIGGEHVSDGYGLNEFPTQKLMMEVWHDKANITPLTRTALNYSSAPQILVGLSEFASGRRPNTPTGRSFIGVGDLDHDGVYETVLIYNSKVARKTEASNTLRGFGAKKVMMLDGGGSTALICQGENYVSSSRPIPQSIAVISASPSSYHYNGKLQTIPSRDYMFLR